MNFNKQAYYDEHHNYNNNNSNRELELNIVDSY